jgi:hypothetical protein
MSFATWLGIFQIVSAAIAVGALIISIGARRDARAKAADIDAGTHSILYREHIWTLHKHGLGVEEIKQLLRRETFRPGVPLSEANAYDNGYCPEVGSVEDVLDPLGRRQSHAPPSVTT